MPGQEELDRISKEIDDYNATVPVDYDFGGVLKSLLGDAKRRKETEPKSEETRHWAVVYTELEKVQAYYQSYLQGVEK